jgi:hypothetical protein
MVTREKRELEIEEKLVKIEREIIEAQCRMIAKRLRRKVSISAAGSAPPILPTDED